MPANVQVILQQDADKLGKSGDLVRVRPGFARNYLLPRQLAVTATAAAVNRLAHDKAVAVIRAEKAVAQARRTASELAALTLTIAQRAGDDGRLFGSVTAKDVQVAAASAGMSLGKRNIRLAEPIKLVGTYEIDIRLDANVSGKVKVNVVAK